jgi:predicted nucleotidyltransferase
MPTTGEPDNSSDKRIGPPNFSEQARLVLRQYIERRFDPRNVVVFLGGSVSRNEALPGSDADAVMVVAANDKPVAQRIKTVEDGIPIDLAIYDLKSLQGRIEREQKMANPWVMDIVASGEMLGNTRLPVARDARRLAREIHDQGPGALNERQTRRYVVEITEVADTMNTARNEAERRFAAALLVPRLAEFRLRQQQQWSGRGRNMLRRLTEADKDYAERLDRAAFTDLVVKNDPRPLMDMVRETLAPAGGLSRSLHAGPPVPPPLPSAK